MSKSSASKHDQPTIILCRHAEKPHNHHGDGPHGVDHHGKPSEHGLVPRGWIRSGAMALYFADSRIDDRELPQPERIYATNPTSSSPSHRALDTATATATRLGLAVNTDYTEGDESALAKNILSEPTTALIVWHHGSIPGLARKLPLAPHTAIPKHWDDDRFDLYWVLTPGASGYTLRVVPQSLVAGDEGV